MPAASRGSRRGSRERDRRPASRGRRTSCGSQRSAGTSRVQSLPARMFSKYVVASGAPANRHPMPINGDFGGASPAHRADLQRLGRRFVRDRLLEGSQLAGENHLDVALASIAQLVDQERVAHPRVRSCPGRGGRGGSRAERPCRRPTTGPRSPTDTRPGQRRSSQWPACSGSRWPPRSRTGRRCRIAPRSRRRAR